MQCHSHARVVIVRLLLALLFAWLAGLAQAGRVTPPLAVADDRFDERNQYTGVAGEVVDACGSYPGTPLADLQNGNSGQSRRYADFSAGSRHVCRPVGADS